MMDEEKVLAVFLVLSALTTLSFCVGFVEALCAEDLLYPLETYGGLVGAALFGFLVGSFLFGALFLGLKILLRGED